MLICIPWHSGAITGGFCNFLDCACAWPMHGEHNPHKLGGCTGNDQVPLGIRVISSGCPKQAEQMSNPFLCTQSTTTAALVYI